MSAQRKTQHTPFMQVAGTHAVVDGLNVFPVNPLTKHPHLKGWRHKATSDLGEIQQWSHQWPNAMCGFPTGRLISGNGFFVVDLDTRGNVSGAASLHALEQKYGPLPKTVRVKTPGRGTHIYFKQPLCKIPTRAGEFGDGIDVRGDGGFVAAPGSARSDGKTYEVLGDVDLDKMAEAPPWVLFHAIFSKGQRARLAARNFHCAEDLGDLPPHQWAAKAREICRVKSDKARAPGALTDARTAAIVRYVKEGVARECLKVSEAVEGTRDDTLQRSVMPCLGLLLGAEQEGVDISALESDVFDAIVAAADALGGEFNEDAVQRKWDAQIAVCDPRDLSNVGLDAVLTLKRSRAPRKSSATS
jgi:hypothetical protein